MNIRKKLIWTAMFTASMGLTACGGSSSGTDTSTTLSGVVADGYLGNATVCLDLNNNKQCDASEPSATTADDGTGSYSLQATAEQRDNNPILVVVTTESTDTDLNGATVAKAFKLSAPAGKADFISPITTMVQTEMDQNPGLTTSQAEGAVKKKLGLSGNGSVDLFANFIEESETSDDYKALYQTAQILARVKGELTETLTATFADAGIVLNSESQKDLEKMVMEFALAQLSDIHTEAKAEIELNGTVSTRAADDITLTVDKTAAENLDATGLEAKITEYDAIESQVVNQATALVADGGLITIAFDDNNATTGLPNIQITTILKEADGFQLYEARGFGAFWLENYSDEQAAKQDMIGDHKDLYSKIPMTVGSEGQLIFNGEHSQIDIHNIVEKPLAGTIVRLREIKGFESNTGVISGTTLENSDTVTFQEGDIEYQYDYTETPTIHLENLSSSSYTELCGTDDQECSWTGPQSATTLAEFREVIHGTYDPSEGLVYLVDATTYEVTSCLYNFSGENYRIPLIDPATNKPTCKNDGMNEPKVLGNLATGTLSDGNTYFTTPQEDYGDSYGEIPYRVYINNSGSLMKKNDNFYANGEERVGVYKGYNFSAAENIYYTYIVNQ